MKHLLGELIEIGDNKYVVTSVCESKDDNSLPRAKVEMWKLPNAQKQVEQLTKGPVYLSITKLIEPEETIGFNANKLHCIKYLKNHFGLGLVVARNFQENKIILERKEISKLQIETINKNIEPYGYWLEVTTTLLK